GAGKPGWGEGVETGRVPEARQIGYRGLRPRGLETIRVPDSPIRQYAAAAAACHAQTFFVNVATLQKLIHSGHQVFVIVTGVVELNDVPEILAVTRRAARVGVEHD